MTSFNFLLLRFFISTPKRPNAPPWRYKECWSWFALGRGAFKRRVSDCKIVPVSTFSPTPSCSSRSILKSKALRFQPSVIPFNFLAKTSRILSPNSFPIILYQRLSQLSILQPPIIAPLRPPPPLPPSGACVSLSNIPVPFSLGRSSLPVSVWKGTVAGLRQTA